MPYVIIILVLLLVVIVIANIKIVPQAHAYVMERLGACLLYTSQLLCRIVEPVCVLTGIQWGNTADLTLGDFSQKRWP